MQPDSVISKGVKCIHRIKKIYSPVLHSEDEDDSDNDMVSKKVISFHFGNGV